MSAKKTNKPIHVPPKPLRQAAPKPTPTNKEVPKVTAVPEMLNVHLRMHFSLPNAPGEPLWPRRTRWKPARPVKNATITVHSVVGRTISAITNDDGDAKLPIAGIDGVQLLTIRPETKQKSLGPAGPRHGSPNFEEEPPYQFRPFDVTIVIEAGGFSMTSPPSVFFVASPGGPPSHAAVFDLTSTDLTLDVKPDWIKTTHRDSTVPQNGKPHPLPTKVNDCLVLHQTGRPEIIGSAINTFIDKKSDVSAHYVIDVDGHIVKMVHESEVARHAGTSFWQGRLGVNNFSIGIEIVHADVDQQGHDASHDFTDAQYDALLRLVTELRTAFPRITRQRIVGHSDVEIVGPDGTGKIHYSIGGRRAGDPGNMFDWARLERAGLVRQVLSGAPPATIYGIARGQRLRPNDSGPGVSQLQQDLASIGYSVNDTDGTRVTGAYDLSTRIAVKRFRIRYFSGSRFALRPPARSDDSLDFDTAFAIRQVLADSGP